MKEIGILFDKESLDAIEDKRKNQTRRLRGLNHINAEPEIWHSPRNLGGGKWELTHGDPEGSSWGTTIIKNPYGITGDRLYHKEPYQRSWFYRTDNRPPARLQDITPEDIIAEGLLASSTMDLYLEWVDRWNGIHKKPGTRWKDNPWVWVNGFEKVVQ